MASLNPFRRRQPSLLASGEQVNMDSDTAVQSILRRQDEWQTRSVGAYDACGEVHNGVDQVADIISGLVIFAAKQPSDKDANPVRTDDTKVIDTVERLGTVDEVGQFLYDYAQLMLMVGEAHILGIQPRPEYDILKETWCVYSHLSFEPTQLPNDDGSITNTIRIPDFYEGKPFILDPREGDTWFRVWRSHPIRRSRADSHIRPILSNVDELLWWDHAAEAVAKNRLITAGAVGVPSNLELPAEAGEPANLSGAQRFVKRFFNMAIKTLQNPGAASSAVPIFYTYPWNESGKSGLDVTSFERPQDELLEKRTDRSLRRIAQGFPLPVESFFGLGNASQFGSREISESKFRENVEPFARFLLQSLTKAWLRPILKQEGVTDWDKYMLWYDASNLIVHPDLPQAADKGFEYGLISGKGWRRIRNISERDAPTPEERDEALEWLKALRGKSQGDGPDAPEDDSDPDNPDEPTEQVPHGRHAPEEKTPATTRGKGQPVIASASSGEVMGRRLAEIDADLLSRIQVMADAAMRREQERAGNKLKNRASRNSRMKLSIKGIPAQDIASTLGRETVIALGLDDLFTDSFESVPDQFSQWCDAAVATAFSIANIRPPYPDSFSLSYQPAEAADLLVRNLQELAKTLLFDRAASIGPSPESDDLLVPVSLVRKALNVAGGNSSSSLLLTTGHAVTKVLGESSGLYAQGYEWWYPPTPRSPFAAHESLNGQIFTLDSPTHPGDTEHCRCVAVPIFT